MAQEGEGAQSAPEDVEKAADALKEAAENAEQSSEQLAAASEQATGLINQIIQATGGGPSEVIYLLGIFILAIFVGYYVVWSVTPALHTPLMSVTNAISSVVIVGALIALGADLSAATGGFWPKAFAFFAVALASVNIFGGFLVTQRMLEMYKRKEKT